MTGVFQSGLGAQLTIGKESVYGTTVARNRSFRFISDSVKRNQNFLASKQLSAGRMFQSASGRVNTTYGAAGTIIMEFPSKQGGIWLDQLHGNVVVPVQQGATTAYKQTHDIGITDPSVKSFSAQIGRPDVGGTVDPFTFGGGKVLGATLKWAVDAFLTAEFTVDFQTETTATALDTFAPASSLHSYNFTLATITVDGSPAGVVKSFELPIAYNYDTGRFGLGGTTKANPVINDYPTVSPTMSVEWTSLALYNKFVNGTISAIIMDQEGPNIASTFNESLKATMTAVAYNGESPNADGPGILTTDIPFDVLDDGTNPPLRLEYMSTDLVL